MVADLEAFLDREFDQAKSYKPEGADWLDGKWAGLGLPKDDERRGHTGVPVAKLRDLGRRLTEMPAGFILSPLIEGSLFFFFLLLLYY
jgi:2-oxoglutarate dehydrogenase E1 component